MVCFCLDEADEASCLDRHGSVSWTFKHQGLSFVTELRIAFNESAHPTVITTDTGPLISDLGRGGFGKSLRWMDRGGAPLGDNESMTRTGVNYLLYTYLTSDCILISFMLGLLGLLGLLAQIRQRYRRGCR